MSTQKPTKRNPIARSARNPGPRSARNPDPSPARKSDVRTGGAPAREARDPHYAREAERYENPLPSRELILDTLAKEGIPVQEESLCQLLHIEPGEEDSFRRRLRAMQR